MACVLWIALALSGCDGRSGFGKGASKGEPLTGPAIFELNLSRGVSEGGGQSLFGALPGSSFSDLARKIRDFDPEETKGVFVRLGTARVGLEMADELGKLLAEVRGRDIPVVCHADDLGNGSMLLVARACSSVWLSPAGSVDTVGIAFQLIFARSLLDKLDVGVDFLQVGKYKGAQEMYTRSGPSPEARESIEGTLRGLRKAWIEGVIEGRKRELEVALEDGPHTAKAAKELGLIDAIGYADEAKKQAKTDSGAERSIVAFGSGAAGQDGSALDVLRSLSGSDPTADPHVAVVLAVGPITMRPAGGLFGGGDGITESGLGKVLGDLTEDEAVKAVVIRIDSPGGSALASDLLWHKLMLLREKKPLVISVGAMAASGGYYLSCAGHRIFAEPTSIVGSIGVVAGKLALKDPLAGIGVNTVTITASGDPARAARAAYMSPFDPWDDATRSKVLVSMEDIYSTFLDRIVEGRGLPREVIEKAAEGRIFGGAVAKDVQLVDELGGLDAAVRYAVERAGLPEDAKVRVRGAPPGLLGALSGEDEAKAATERAKTEIDPVARLGEALPPEARAWLGATSPLLDGERTLAALPFVLVLR